MLSDLHILIVEDDILAQDSLIHQLQQLGARHWHTARNSTEALRLLRSEAPVDLAILDVQLHRSELDGIALAAHIRDERPMPTLILSSHDETHIVDRTHGLPDSTYLVKPASTPQLRVSLQRLLLRAAERQTFQSAYTITTMGSFIVRPVNEPIRKIDIADVLCLEATGGGVEFTTTKGKVFVHQSMKKTLARLTAPLRLVRTHQSYAFPLAAYYSSTEEQVTVCRERGGEEHKMTLPVSVRYRKEVAAALRGLMGV